MGSCQGVPVAVLIAVILPAHASAPPASAFAKPRTAVAQGPVAYFDWFEYTGRDRVFEQPLPPGTYRNPVLAGFYPDPSITRVGDTYYLVNSTFTYFPGIPVFESHDLVHWRQIGNVFERPGEFVFDGLSVSRGMFAPTIRYRDGLFYVVCTAVDAGGNFLSVARNPAGPWSDPIPLLNLEGGIDPSLFFDQDGKAYLLNNGLPIGAPRYAGHRAIWIQEFDPASRNLVGPRKVLINGGIDISKQPVWIEGPHMYRYQGWYYLMAAEGGTSTQHSEVILRARSPWGPFKPYAGNPILTQRDLAPDRANAIANAGHADLVEATDGTWWAVFLASRTYEGVHYNTGRETYMLPVTWRDGWPIILPAGKEIPYVVKAPAAAAAPNATPASNPAAAPNATPVSNPAAAPHGTPVSNPAAAPNATAALSPATPAPNATPLTGNFTWRDDFNAHVLQPQWLTVRVPKQPWADLTSRAGWLAIHALRTPLESLENMSFLGRRQQHLAFDASTELEVPTTPGMSVGLVAFQNENDWYFLGVRRHGTANAEAQKPLQLFLEKRGGKQTVTVAQVDIGASPHLKLKIAGDSRSYSFYFDADGSGWKPLEENDDGSILSTDIAGGFVGAFVGPYARAE